MYLHDFGEDAASFTKEEMSQGYTIVFIYLFETSLFSLLSFFKHQTENT
jgi:hypothetical protein